MCKDIKEQVINKVKKSLSHFFKGNKKWHHNASDGETHKKIKNKIAGTLTIFFVFVVLQFTASIAIAQEIKVFEDGYRNVQVFPKTGPRIIQSRIAEIKIDSLTQRELIFNLFPDAEFIGIPENFRADKKAISGKLKDVPGSLFTLVLSNSKFYAALHAGGRDFSIDPLDRDKYKIDELDVTEALLCGTVLAGPDPAKVLKRFPATFRGRAPTVRADGREITILVFYSDGVALIRKFFNRP